MNSVKSNIYLIGLIICNILTSCESENTTPYTDPEFSIKFSEGTIINEKDITFYDSSTCILFLNKDLNIIVGTEPPSLSFTEFSVFVDEDTIYSGIVFPSNYFNIPPDLFIYSNTFPTLKSDILPIIIPFYLKDTLNDPRILEALGKSNLLYQGITCSLDSVKKSTDNDSTLIYTITFTNFDQVNYYIPDPNKMGVMNFNVIARIFFINKVTNEEWLAESNWENFNWNISLDNLSKLKSNDKITFTFTAPLRKPINKGFYDFHLSVSTSIIKLGISLNIPLKQEDGRIWQGQYFSGIKSISIQ